MSTTDQLILPSIAKVGHGVSEFAKRPDGKIWNGACNFASLEVGFAAYWDRAPDINHMSTIAWDALKRGYCTADNGATRIDLLADYAKKQLSLPIALQWNYQEPLLVDWHAVLEENAGKRPIILQWAYASRLIDIETGVRDEAAARGLRYHTNIDVGKQKDGYIFCDCDHPQVNSRFQIYAYDLRDKVGNVVNCLRAAVPCGLLMLDMPAPKPVPVPKPTPPPAPKPPPPPVDPYKTALQTIATLAESALLKG